MQVGKEPQEVPQVVEQDKLIQQVIVHKKKEQINKIRGGGSPLYFFNPKSEVNPLDFFFTSRRSISQFLHI